MRLFLPAHPCHPTRREQGCLPSGQGLYVGGSRPLLAQPALCPEHRAVCPVTHQRRPQLQEQVVCHRPGSRGKTCVLDLVNTSHCFIKQNFHCSVKLNRISVMCCEKI